MIKLVVSDVDGTILTGGQTVVPDNVFEAIEKLKKAGKSVAIASGRTYGSLERLFAPVKQDLYFICCDGAVTVHNDKVMYCKQIGMGDVMDVIRRSEYDKYGIILCTPKQSLVIRGGEDVAAAAQSQSGEKPTIAERLYDIKEPVVKISVLADDGRATDLNFLPKSLRVAYNVGEWCEYTSAISNKGLAVSDLQMRLYLTKFDTAAVGDGINDVEMMKKAKIAASANGAGDELRAVCNYHTEDVAGFLNNLCDK